MQDTQATTLSVSMDMLDMPAFILAGGQGERLAPLTEQLPKPVVSFGGIHRIIDFTISNCLNSGLQTVSVLTQHKREPLHDYIRQLRSRFGPEDRRLVCLPPASGKRYRGTADAVFQNLQVFSYSRVPNILIASGDHVYTMDYRKLLAHHMNTRADMTIAVKRVPAGEASSFGVVDVGSDGIVTGFREKPAEVHSFGSSETVAVNMGVYIFRRDVLFDLAGRVSASETDFGHHVIPMMFRSYELAAYVFENEGEAYWRDVGTLDSYYEASMDLLGPQPLFLPERDPQWPIHPVSRGGVNNSADNFSRISPMAVTKGAEIWRSVISDGVHIEPGAVVENSIVLPGARIAKGVRLRNTIVAEGADISGSSRIGYSPILDKRYLVTPGGVVVVTGTTRERHETAEHHAA